MTAVLEKAPTHTGALASFRQRSFRFQWMADLSTSWAFEMETIMLSWYILVETKSVLLLTLFASTQYIGTLLSPLFGVMGHRIGNKRVYCAMRACYTALAMIMMLLVLGGQLSPLYVFIISALMGLVRPRDLVLRYSLIGETMPTAQLMAATSVSRTTQDSARVMGALAGAAIVALLGSIFLSRTGTTLPPARMMIVFCALWYCMALVFAHMPNLTLGILMLIVTGCAQSLGMVPMSAMLLQNTGKHFRGHVMGIRMLMIYGLPVGLLIAGPLITHLGYRVMAVIYCVFGLAITAGIALRWRAHVWALDAPGNRH